MAGGEQSGGLPAPPRALRPPAPARTARASPAEQRLCAAAQVAAGGGPLAHLHGPLILIRRLVSWDAAGTPSLRDGLPGEDCGDVAGKGTAGTPKAFPKSCVSVNF